MSAGIGAASTLLASFAASLVEGVEALTIVLAVGTVRGWRWALTGSAAAVGVLAVLVVSCGASIARIPLAVVQIVVGTLLLMFGLRWLRKAILRYVGVIALHDEAAAYAKETATLRASAASARSGWDAIAFGSAFKIVMLEGIEVVFIVIAMGAGGRLIAPAALGAAAALVVVVVLGAAIHRPLAKIPENTLKFAVSLLLCAFGSFWLGEGIDLHWPAEDWSLAGLIAWHFLIAAALIAFARSRMQPPGRGVKKSGWALPVLLSLFVDDYALAVGVLVWSALAWLSVSRLSVGPLADCALFVAGFSALLVSSVLRAVARP